MGVTRSERAINTSLLGEYSASALELFVDFLKEKQSFIIAKKDTTLGT